MQRRKILKFNYEFLYLFCYSFIIAYYFFQGTMFSINYTKAIKLFLLFLDFLMLSAQAIRLFNNRRFQITKFILCVVIVGLLLIEGVYRRYFNIINLGVLILCAVGVDQKKIVKAFFCVIGSLTLFTVISALAGFIPNLVNYRDAAYTVKRYAFGMEYPTDFCTRVLFLMCSYYWLRGEECHLFEYAFVIPIAIFFKVFCDANLSCACILALGLILFVIRCFHCNSIKSKIKHHKLNNAGSFFLPWIPYIFCAFIIIMSYCYDKSSSIMVKLNSIFHDRLRLGKIGLDRYKITLFGQSVPMNGNGGSTDKKTIHYFFLDSSYINILLKNGAATLFCILSIFSILILRNYKIKKYDRVFILILIVGQCIFEHHIIELSFLPFLVIPFADFNDKNVAK